MRLKQVPHVAETGSNSPDVFAPPPTGQPLYDSFSVSAEEEARLRTESRTADAWMSAETRPELTGATESDLREAASPGGADPHFDAAQVLTDAEDPHNLRR